MASYELRIKKSAARELEAVGQKRDRRRVAERIQRLGEEPRPPGCEKLSGLDRYRVRQGNYRILYAVDDDASTVTGVKIGHRRDVYR
ncbi:MAG: type II toxin-antitoxin system RelE/ParE family toxin [Myxococcota bacterium]